MHVYYLLYTICYTFGCMYLINQKKGACIVTLYSVLCTPYSVYDYHGS